MQRTGTVGELPDGLCLSNLRGYALVEGEVAYLVRPKLDPIVDVLAYPTRGHGDRRIGVLACLPQAERQACLVTKVGKAVPDEPGLVPERPQHAVLGNVGELLKGALLDLVCCDAHVLHACSPLLVVPLTNRGQREPDSSGTRSGYQAFAGTSDGTRSAEAIPRESLRLPSGTGYRVFLKYTSLSRGHDGVQPQGTSGLEHSLLSLAGADGLNLNRPLEVVLCEYHGLQGPSPVGPSQSEQRGSSRSGIGRREAGVPDAARTSTRTESQVHRLGLSLTHQPRDRKALVKADSAVYVRFVSEGGFEPPRAIRALGPQPSASAKFRHSDGAARDSTKGARGPYGSHCQASQKVHRVKMTAVATVILSRRRSRAVPPVRVPPPPNMSDRPLPLPEWRRMNSTRNSADTISSTITMVLTILTMGSGLQTSSMIALSSSGKWQAAICPGWGGRGAGASAAHGGICALGHRGWNRQPDGGSIGEGTSPSRMIRFLCAASLGSAIGTAERSAPV